ncbi:hypothetical protein HDU99_004726, partial [Rhizoclosmatium hyalinum]
HQCKVTGKKTHCQFFAIRSGMSKAVSHSLPASYQIGLAVEGLLEEECKCFEWNLCPFKGKNLTSAKTLLLIQYLLSHNMDPSIQNNVVFCWACAVGPMKAVELLLEHSSVDPADRENEAIVNAASGGHINILKRLLPLPNVDPNANEDMPLYFAACHGHSDVVNFMLKLPRTDPKKAHSEALYGASHGRHKDTMKLLLTDEFVDPSKAMYLTALRNQPEILDIMLKDGRGHPTGPDIHQFFVGLCDANTFKQ